MNLFSIRNNEEEHKVITILGIKCKFKRKNISIDEKKELWILKARRLGVKIGNNNQLISDICWGTEPFLIEIGNNNVISFEVTFLTHDGSVCVGNNLNGTAYSKLGKITIGDNCFIGCRSIILPNVKIGNNCIIGAGSVVTKNVPDNEVWAGNPARFIKTADKYNNQIEILNNTKEQQYLQKYATECAGKIITNM